MANRASIRSDYSRNDEIIRRREDIIATEEVDKLKGNRGGEIVSKEEVDTIQQGNVSTASNLNELRNDFNSQANEYLPSSGGVSSGVLRYDKTYTLSGLDLATVSFVLANNSGTDLSNITPLATDADLAAVIAKINEMVG